MGDVPDNEKELPVDAMKSEYANEVSVKCPESVYLQYIDSKSLLNEMTNLDALFELNCSTGSFTWG